jgi:tricorn protease
VWRATRFVIISGTRKLILIKNVCVLAVVMCTSLLSGQDEQEGRLLLFPDVHKDKVAFVYGGDLWLASSSGGAARRITSSPGRELFPKFSPDGKWLAFTGQYDGNFNVYVMASDGGQPKQLTFYQGSAQPLPDRMGVLNQVIGWTPDSKDIVFLSRRDATNGWTKRPYVISISGGLAQLSCRKPPTGYPGTKRSRVSRSTWHDQPLLVSFP